jgi:hypothetical protein
LAEKEDSECYAQDWNEYLATGQVLYEEEPSVSSARAKLAQIVDDKAMGIQADTCCAETA